MNGLIPLSFTSSGKNRRAVKDNLQHKMCDYEWMALPWENQAESIISSTNVGVHVPNEWMGSAIFALGETGGPLAVKA